MFEEIIDKTNSPDISQRLSAVSELADLVKNKKIAFPVRGRDVNNHVHTIYSFSPYTPSGAVWKGFEAGLSTIGIMDHDSVSGASEFISAASALGIAATVGAETRVKMNDTALNGRRINNPDQKSIAYVALHGIPHTQLDAVKQFFVPYSAKRLERDRKMLENLNRITAPYGIEMDFDHDVLPLSRYSEGGSVTERHLLFALSKKIVGKFGKGDKLIDFLTNGLGIALSSKVKERLTDPANRYYEYDLLGALKSGLVSRFYIDADEECPDVKQIAELARKTHSILAYAYLGDVTDSVTGDKKAQKFEDEYLDLLFDTLKAEGFNAVTYMPSRNTLEQLRRVRGKCDEYGLFQISGEDINTPRQSFICMAQRSAEFDNLYDAAWALIGHELSATENLDDSFCSEKTIDAYPLLSDRIEHFKNVALQKY